MPANNTVSHILFSFILLASNTEFLFADTNATELTQEWLFGQQLDNFQEYWSRKVLILSAELDQIGLNQFNGNEKENNLTDINTSQCEQQSNPKQAPNQIPLPFDPFIEKDYANLKQVPYQISLPFDEFFKDDIYLDKTNKTYIKASGGYEFNCLGQSTILRSISVRIRLPKIENRLHLFINDIKEAQKEIAQKKVKNSQIIKQTSSDAGIGIKYYAPSVYKNIYSNISIGLAGITNPYAKTYFEYLILFTDWQISSSQNFKYSPKKNLDEWTDIYIDRKLSRQDLLRLFLQRSTNSEHVGMEYLSQLSYTNMLEKETSCMYYIALNGRTKDATETLYQNGLNPREGVYNYSTGIVWRQQFFKDYLYYQIEPTLSYHEEHNYKPNYLLRFTIDIFFESRK